MQQRFLALLAIVATLATLLPGAAWARGLTANPVGASQGVSTTLARSSLGGGPVAPDDYESDDSADDATELELDGIPQERTLHVRDDNDWVSFSLAAGERVQLYTTGFCDTFMFLYAEDGTTLLRRDDDSGEDLNAMIQYTSRVDGTYYLRVVYYNFEDVCTSYELVGQLLPPVPGDAYEPDDALDLASELPLDATLQERSIHEPGNEDWVAFSLQAGNRVNVFTTGRCDTLLFLYAPDGVTLLADDDDGGVGLNADIEYVVSEAGVYYIRVRLLDDGDVCERYELSGTLLPPVPADRYENDDTSAQAKPLPLDGTPQEHTFHIAGDNDWVSFQLNSGDRVFLMTTGPCDTLLFLYQQDGTTLLRRDDDSGEDLNAAILYTALTTGTYYVRVSPISRSRGICDGYRLYGSRFPITVPTPTVGAPVTPTVGAPVTPTATPPADVPSGPSPTPAAPAPTGPSSTPAPASPTPAAASPTAVGPSPTATVQRPPGF